MHFYSERRRTCTVLSRPFDCDIVVQLRRSDCIDGNLNDWKSIDIDNIIVRPDESTQTPLWQRYLTIPHSTLIPPDIHGTHFRNIASRSSPLLLIAASFEYLAFPLSKLNYVVDKDGTIWMCNSKPEPSDRNHQEWRSVRLD